MKRRVFGILAGLSLLLFAAVVWMWARSFHENSSLLSWMNNGFRYTLRSHWGQLLIVGPPVGETDTELEALAGRMSSADFEWTVAAGYAQGEVREGTATWEMYERVRERLGGSANLSAEKRTWVRGLEEPDRYPSCHLMLLLAAQDEWRKRYVDERKQPWHDASAAGWRLVLFVRADEAGTGPELSGNELARERWGMIVDEARVRVFYGWLAFVALVLPVAWAARPRREPRTVGRWVFNAASLASVLLLLIAGGMWVRSYRITEQWTFASRAGEPVPGLHVDWHVQRWMASGRGRLVLYEHQVPEGPGLGFSVRAQPSGYARGGSSPDFFRALLAGGPRQGERHWKVPGAQFYAMPPQAVRLNVGAGRAVYGMRYFEVSWWVLVTAATFLPLIWLWRDWRWRWRARRVSEKTCVKCGYDLRASVRRCPECGEAIEAAVA